MCLWRLWRAAGGGRRRAATAAGGNGDGGLPGGSRQCQQAMPLDSTPHDTLLERLLHSHGAGPKSQARGATASRAQQALARLATLVRKI